MTPATNIFAVISEVTSSTERFHSSMLASFLQSDQDFAARFLAKALPDSFEAKNEILSSIHEMTVKAEYALPSKERIDIVLVFPKAFIAIEVKVVDASSRKGQLKSYWDGLVSIVDPSTVKFLIYLTPFTRTNIPAKASVQQVGSITDYELFSDLNPGASNHISWNEVIALYSLNCDNKTLGSSYQQHSEYVQATVCDPNLFDRMLGGRDLAKFLGPETIQRFFAFLASQQIHFDDSGSDVVITLVRNVGKEGEIIRAIGLLLESERIQKGVKKYDPSDDIVGIRKRLEGTSGGRFFADLFRYLDSLEYVWLEGISNLGVRVVLEDVRSFSICTLSEQEIRMRRER